VTTLRDLSDAMGPLVPNTPDEEAAALLVALRASRDADEAIRFRAMLGLGAR
jgi:hypothetical protein